MITRIDGLDSAGGGKVTFCVTADNNGADEDVTASAGGSTHVHVGPGTDCNQSISTGQSGRLTVVLTAQTSGTKSAPFLLDL